MSAAQPVKIGIVGVGRMGRRHAENLASRVPGAELVAACSPIGEELEWARDTLGVTGLYKDYAELLAHPVPKLFANLVTEKDDDWIWNAMIAHPDLIGGFNRLDSTVLKACGGRVLAKEGADGLLGLSIEHPEYPEGLGVVVKIAHGWNPQATWYIARYILGVLGFEFRNPYKLRRQKAFIVPEAIPPNLRERMAAIVPWDSWDPDIDRWEFDPEEFIAPR